MLTLVPFGYAFLFLLAYRAYKTTGTSFYDFYLAYVLLCLAFILTNLLLLLVSICLLAIVS